METYEEMYEKARRANEGPQGREFITWIIVILAIPSLIGWVASRLLTVTTWGKDIATGLGIVIGFICLIVEVWWVVWYADNHGWLDIWDVDKNELE